MLAFENVVGLSNALVVDQETAIGCKSQHSKEDNAGQNTANQPFLSLVEIFPGNIQHRLHGGGRCFRHRWLRSDELRNGGDVRFQKLLLFCGATGQQVIHTQAEGRRQRLQKGHVGVAEPAFPFADGFVGNVQRLGQLLLGQPLPLSVFGDESAELLFVQSDHLAIHCTRQGGKCNRPAV